MHVSTLQIRHIFSTKVGLETAPLAPATYYRCVRSGDVQKHGVGVQLDHKTTTKNGGTVMRSLAILWSNNGLIPHQSQTSPLNILSRTQSIVGRQESRVLAPPVQANVTHL
jgi:hypothetical protein